VSTPRILVLAKAPVAGRVKTRLGAYVGLARAAEVAAAALLDTVRACTDAVGTGHCHLALAGDLRQAVRADELARALDGWTIRTQRGAGFAARLVNAHHDLGPGPSVQIGMDTPQVTPDLLLGAAHVPGEHDAVLGPAEDGGWWVLGLADSRHAAALAHVEMSTPRTHDDTRHALEERGLRVGSTAMLRDVDTARDAEAVAAGLSTGHFARAWSAVLEAVS
jgi:glycosyltransferase A (GT-A) superfamily protein (DUF2064 family)